MAALSPERWRVLSPYLDEALEIATEDRAAWLASIFARDASLATELKTLLAEHDIIHDSHFLARRSGARRLPARVAHRARRDGQRLAGRTL
jgi:hypothetical protein